jgi:mandelate racemase
VRSAVGKEIALMVDYNQFLSVSEAHQRLKWLDEEGLSWIEEPTRADDYTGHAQISRFASTPIQLGENWWGLHDMAKSVAAGASDLVMVDVMKIGGVTGWLRAAALAASAGLPLSSHTFPEISAHLLAVTPTVHWLEYLDLAGTVLQTKVTVEKGYVMPSSLPGTGLNWQEDMVERFLRV